MNALVSSSGLPLNSLTPVLTEQFQIRIQPSGPCPAKLMFVGEGPLEKDLEAGQPFQGTSGWLLDDALISVAIPRGLIFMTTVAREKAPYHDPAQWVATTIKKRTPRHKLIDNQWVDPILEFGRILTLQEVDECKPDVIVAFGNVALWALTGLWGIRKWRSSILETVIHGHKYKVIPVIQPAAILREYSLKGIFYHDLRRVKTELARGPAVVKPDWKFTIRPAFSEAVDILTSLLVKLDRATAPVPIASDIETRAGHTACVCVCWSSTEGLCIPWMCIERPEGYWSFEEEVELILLLRLLYTHPMVELIWQNGAYDHQYEARWHFVVPKLGWDTMVAHHSMFSISPKSLDHLSSIYCDYHRYWKEDGRNWDPSSMPEEQFWNYNCEDGVRTFEIAERQKEVIQHLITSGWTRLQEVVDFQHDLQPAVVRMMLRGVRSDDLARSKMAMALMARTADIQSEITEIAGQDLNTRSPKQMTEFFYETLAQTPIFGRNPDGTRGNLTCDDDALGKIAARQPILRGLISRIQAMRSAGVFLSTYVQMPRDADGRLRCSYNVAGTKTYRFSSSQNAFGSGGNLQNIPEGDSEDAPSLIALPNIRELFLFDHGMTGFDLDGDSADLRIVTGESGCKAMQAYFEAKVKPYVEIAKEFYRDPTITKKHHSYKLMKALCHGTNYGGSAAGVAFAVGLSVHDCERMQKWYFGMCPEIKAWQEDIINQGQNRGYIENPFGYRLYNWDRWSRQVANEFLAWTPQSTVGILINKILYKIDKELPKVQLLLQVHDSLTGQFPSYLGGVAERQILTIADSITIPCRTGPIKVPSGMKTSDTSWGACK